MKFGYPEFRYGNDLKRKNVNVGDNIQSLAIRALYDQLQIPAHQVVGIDRDSLPAYRGEPVKLIMNGCFHDDCFPLPPQIHPIFFGFNAETESVITKNRALFEKHQPIGCRDMATKQMLEKHKISAYVTGCTTLTFRRRDGVGANATPVIAFGSGPGALPSPLLQKIPKSILERARLVYQREAVQKTPLNDSEVNRLEGMAAAYLDIYRNQTSLVITPLLHVASPCLALGVPVILARRDRGHRFSAIDRLLPVYTPDDFNAIDWNPSPPDLRILRGAMVNAAAELLRGAQPEQGDLAVLAETFEARPVLSGNSPASVFGSVRRLFSPKTGSRSATL